MNHGTTNATEVLSRLCCMRACRSYYPRFKLLPPRRRKSLCRARPELLLCLNAGGGGALVELQAKTKSGMKSGPGRTINIVLTGSSPSTCRRDCSIFFSLLVSLSNICQDGET